jgi:hypothetical protein
MFPLGSKSQETRTNYTKTASVTTEIDTNLFFWARENIQSMQRCVGCIDVNKPTDCKPSFIEQTVRELNYLSSAYV